MMPVRLLLFVLLLLSITGCGRAGDSDDPANGNQSPVANAGPDLTVPEGLQVVLAGTGIDPEGVVTYAWQQTSGVSVSLVDADTASASFIAPFVTGVLRFSLTVTDVQGRQHRDYVAVNVTGNVAPVANAGADQSATINSPVTLHGSATDDNGIAHYFWQQTSGPIVTLSDNTLTAPTFTAPATPTALGFRLLVTDTSGVTHNDSMNVFVTYAYEPAPSTGTVSYVRTEQLNIDTDADCPTYGAPYHPASIRNIMNPYNQITSGRFAVIWGNDYSNLNSGDATVLTQLKTDNAMRQRVADSLLDLQQFLIDQHHLELTPSLSAVDGNCYRINLYMYGTGIYAGDTNPNGGGGAVCDSSGDLVIPHIFLPPGNLVFMANSGPVKPWMVAHEYTHTLQCRVARGDATGWSWYIESFANYIGNDAEDITVALDQFHQNLQWSLDTFLTRYGVWPFWMYLSHNFGYEFTGDALQRTSYANESTLQFLRRISPFDCVSGDDVCRNEAFANLYGNFAASTVNYVNFTQAEGVDYRTLAHTNWVVGQNRLSAHMYQIDTQRYRIADWLAPQRFGHNIIEIIPDRTSPTLSVKLDGWNVPARESQWRAMLVATLDENSVPPVEAYGEMFVSGEQVVSLDDWETDLGRPIRRLHLVVAATPLNWKSDAVLSAFDAPARYRELDRYVYDLTINGGWPSGHEPEYKRAAPGLGALHANGGGFVASTASVAATAYVAPQARVLGHAQVQGLARIEGRAMIDDYAVVRDNAIVSSSAVVRGNAVVEDDATVRDNALLTDNTHVMDQGKVQGDAALWSNYAVNGQGMSMGIPLTETTGTPVISGTAISDGARWLSSGTVTQGTSYNVWTQNDNGLLLHYDFSEAHPYRLHDVHGSSDAYYLGLDNVAGQTALMQNDTTLGSQVLMLDGNGMVALPRWLLDQSSYQLSLRFYWQGSAGSATLLDATTSRDEHLRLQLLAVDSNRFDMLLSVTDRNAVVARLTLSDTQLQAASWMQLSLTYDDTTHNMTLAVQPVGAGTPVSDQLSLSYDTREFDYDSLQIRLGAAQDGNDAFAGRVDDIRLTR